MAINRKYILSMRHIGSVKHRLIEVLHELHLARARLVGDTDAVDESITAWITELEKIQQDVAVTFDALNKSREPVPSLEAPAPLPSQEFCETRIDNEPSTQSEEGMTACGVLTR
jgi:hypothetical protein